MNEISNKINLNRILQVAAEMQSALIEIYNCKDIDKAVVEQAVIYLEDWMSIVKDTINHFPSASFEKLGDTIARKVYSLEDIYDYVAEGIRHNFEEVTSDEGYFKDKESEDTYFCLIDNIYRPIRRFYEAVERGWYQ